MAKKFEFKLHYWPMLTVVWFGATFLISYLVSVFGSRNVYWLLPFISDTGANPPESCIFGQMLNLGALFMGITMYIRYRQVQLAIDSDEIVLKQSWNTWAKWCGLIACLGMSFVANFQETTVGAMHFFGAIGAFGIGSVYFIVSTRISYAFRAIFYKYPVVGVSRKLLWFRLFLSVCFFPLFFTNTVASAVAMSQFDGETITWWTEENAGFGLRLVGTIAEWFMAIFMLLYIMTYTREFKALEFREIVIEDKRQCEC